MLAYVVPDRLIRGIASSLETFALPPHPSYKTDILPESSKILIRLTPFFGTVVSVMSIASLAVEKSKQDERSDERRDILLLATAGYGFERSSKSNQCD
jgi:hypothetical protein